MKKIMCLYGQPGCGKSTQSRLLTENYGFKKFGMGERLRAEIASGSDLGQKMKPYVETGLLIPDEMMAEIIKHAGQEAERGLIFDGFPRIVSQAQMLDEIMGRLGLQVDAFIYLHLSADQALERIKKRAALEGNRSDDVDVSALKNRFTVFDEESASLLDYYWKQDKLHELNGDLSVEEISKQIAQIIE